MEIKKTIELLNGTFFDNKLTELYVDLNRIPYEKERYRKAIDSYKTFFGEGEIEIFSAPGRSEIGGNHTDHQHGEVLAASINNDAIAVARKLDEPIVKVMSDGYSGMIIVQLDELAKKNRRRRYHECTHPRCTCQDENGWSCNWRISGICDQ